MTKIQEEVWNFLLTRHAGGENAMPRAAILTRFNLVRHAINYLDSVLTEVGDRRRALAEADPLER